MLTNPVMYEYKFNASTAYASGLMTILLVRGVGLPSDGRSPCFFYRYVEC